MWGPEKGWGRGGEGAAGTGMGRCRRALGGGGGGSSIGVGRSGGAWARGCRLGRADVVEFEEAPGLLEAERRAVDGELVVAGVFGHVVDVLNLVAFFTERLHEKVDVYHAGHYRARL